MRRFATIVVWIGMLRRVAVPSMLLAVALTAGCKKGKEICQRAADTYETCVREKLGEELYQRVKPNQEPRVNTCIDDDKTIAMYEHCLPEKTCDAFMTCVEDYIIEHGP